MPKRKSRIPQDLEKWIDARKRHNLSHAHIQMARELGMNPSKFGKIDNHKQEPWKAPLPIFIEDIYFKRFKKERPDEVHRIEDIAQMRQDKSAQRRQRKEAERNAV
jgi:hypothetical protein